MSIRRFLCKLGIHRYYIHQHNLTASEYYDKRVDFVICWKQCIDCAKSKLVHLLE